MIHPPDVIGAEKRRKRQLTVEETYVLLGESSPMLLVKFCSIAAALVASRARTTHFKVLLGLRFATRGMMRLGTLANIADGVASNEVRSAQVLLQTD